MESAWKWAWRLMLMVIMLLVQQPCENAILQSLAVIPAKAGIQGLSRVMYGKTNWTWY